MNPSELLSAAADRVREGSPLVSPAIAEPLADWLQKEALQFAEVEHLFGHDSTPALRLARQIMGAED